MASNKIARFLTERGVAAPPPDRPVETYAKYWERTARWMYMAGKARRLVNEHGPEKAREILNMAVGQPVFWTDKRLVPELGTHGTYGFVLLPGGCQWALQKDVGGQCAFCEFQEIVDYVAGDLPFSHQEFMALFDSGYETMQYATMINVFTAGSFLAPGEIPQESQLAMADAVSRSPNTRILRVESRVQYMVEETIKPLVATLAARKKTLDIAIGFETQDDYMRNKLLRKGMGRAAFIKGVKTAKECGARVSVYVMLMPLDIDIAEGFAVEECIESIRFAFECGADEVLLQARYSHYEHIKCPKLWSIAKVLRNTAHLGPVMLGRWENELPEPKIWPKNCGVCDPAVLQALTVWRDSLDPTSVAEATLPECACKADWQASLNDVTKPYAKPLLPIVTEEDMDKDD